VLALKAAALQRPRQLGGWLYGVAYRTALEAKAAAARRRRKEAAVSLTAEPAATDPEPLDDLRQALDHEVANLPEKYRAAVVLCELEGRSRKDAARQLRIAEGTLSSRLATARRMLAARLATRGFPRSAAALAATVAAAKAAVPPGWVAAVAGAAVRVANGEAVAAVAAAPVASLTQKVVKVMYLSQLKVPFL